MFDIFDMNYFIIFRSIITVYLNWVFPLIRYLPISTGTLPAPPFKIDLSRVMIMLGLDIAALMGYTGALFLKFFGSASGILITLFSMICWIVVPSYFMIRIAKRKDF